MCSKFLQSKVGWLLCIMYWKWRTTLSTPLIKSLLKSNIFIYSLISSYTYLFFNKIQPRCVTYNFSGPHLAGTSGHFWYFGESYTMSDICLPAVYGSQFFCVKKRFSFICIIFLKLVCCIMHLVLLILVLLSSFVLI